MIGDNEKVLWSKSAEEQNWFAEVGASTFISKLDLILIRIELKKFMLEEVVGRSCRVLDSLPYGSRISSTPIVYDRFSEIRYCRTTSGASSALHPLVDLPVN